MNSSECTIVFWNMLMLFDYGMTHELLWQYNNILEYAYSS